MLPAGPITVSVNEAVLLCLENNRSLVVERLAPAIRKTAEEQERALFDPILDAEVSAGRVKGERLARSGSETEAYTPIPPTATYRWNATSPAAHRWPWKPTWHIPIPRFTMTASTKPVWE
jgi:hypothetical protein